MPQDPRGFGNLGGLKDKTLEGWALPTLRLDGATGENSLSGGSGDDLYTVDSLGDRITEALNAGTDSVKASVDWTLGDNLENLTLTSTRAINGTGNALANVISGNSAGNSLLGLGGDDTLIGGNGNDVLDGGAGDDALTGGAGNDIYIIDSVGDRVTEGLNAGTDTVQASISWVLGDNLENLVLTGNEPISGTGNALNNVITGNAVRNSLFGMGGNDTLTGGDGDDLLDGGDGNDTLTGGAGNDIITGGFGNDVLTGNAGADRFVLNQPGQGVDKIADFVAIEDKLLVSASVFGGGLVAGAGITADQLRVGAGAVAATSANQRFIYNTSTGALYFDADGNLGGAASIQVSTLTTKPLIGSGSFAITL